MEYTEIVSKMNVYLIKAAQLCRKWLAPRLKRVDSLDWWHTTVCANLRSEEHTSELQSQR